MLFSHTNQFIFIQVGKTGGMSLRDAPRPFSSEPDKFRKRRPAKMRGEQINPLYTVWETLLLHPGARDVEPGDFARFFRFPRWIDAPLWHLNRSQHSDYRSCFGNSSDGIRAEAR